MAHIGYQYNFEVIRGDDSGLIEEYVVDNVMLNKSIEAINTQPLYLWLGTGTTTPTRFDDAIEVYGYRASLINSQKEQYTVTEVTRDYLVRRYDLLIGQVIIASGDFTEIGCGLHSASDSRAISRALIRDADGNPTVLSLTALDRLKLKSITMHIKVKGFQQNWTQEISVDGVVQQVPMELNNYTILATQMNNNVSNPNYKMPPTVRESFKNYARLLMDRKLDWGIRFANGGASSTDGLFNPFLGANTWGEARTFTNAPNPVKDVTTGNITHPVEDVMATSWGVDTMVGTWDTLLFTLEGVIIASGKIPNPVTIAPLQTLSASMAGTIIEGWFAVDDVADVGETFPVAENIFLNTTAIPANVGNLNSIQGQNRADYLFYKNGTTSEGYVEMDRNLVRSGKTYSSYHADITNISSFTHIFAQETGTAIYGGDPSHEMFMADNGKIHRISFGHNSVYKYRESFPITSLNAQIAGDYMTRDMFVLSSDSEAGVPHLEIYEVEYDDIERKAPIVVTTLETPASGALEVKAVTVLRQLLAVADLTSNSVLFYRITDLKAGLGTLLYTIPCVGTLGALGNIGGSLAIQGLEVTGTTALLNNSSIMPLT